MQSSTELHLGTTMYGIMVIANATGGVMYVTKAQDPTPFNVTFYTKTGCHLCEAARDMLEDIAALTTYVLTEIDIRSNPVVFEKYRYRIPVILINDETLIEGHIEFRDLAKAFHLR
jgi:glutaredoxin